jgi:hypothetical protein
LQAILFKGASSSRIAFGGRKAAALRAVLDHGASLKSRFAKL